MTNPDHSNLSEQALSKAIEVGISSQLQEAEEIEVEIHSDPLQLIQGEVNSVRVKGRGMVTPQNLRVEEVILQSDHIAVNLLRTALGSLRLEYLEDASLRIRLTERDFNQILQSDYLREELSPLTIQTANETLVLWWGNGSIQLREQQTLVLEGEITAEFSQGQQEVRFRLVFRIAQGGEVISLVAGEYCNETELPLEITTILLTEANKFLQVRLLNLSALQVVVEQIELQTQELMMQFSLKAET